MHFFESVCPGCAGTGNLRLKRVLDSVGLGIQARFPARSERELFSLMRDGSWLALHSRTPYNFSSPWNGGSIRAAFMGLCREVAPGGEGIVFLEVDPMKGGLGRILGVVCQGGGGSAYWPP